jgi:hypothetical protein
MKSRSIYEGAGVPAIKPARVRAGFANDQRPLLASPEPSEETNDAFPV